jgi:calcineurin-like phosphoesterase family protein
MGTIFLTADTHFGHNGVCVFTRQDGTKLRPWDNAEEMDEAMIKLWNDTVRPKDKVYVLGDLVINRKALGKTLPRLNGEKVLVKGNHDIFKLDDYVPYFKDIRGYHVLSGMIMSHIPIHQDSLARFGCNIHGHLHEKRVMLNNKIDPRYFSVSVECTDFKPISLEQAIEKIKLQGGDTNFKQVSAWGSSNKYID